MDPSKAAKLRSKYVADHLAAADVGDSHRRVANCSAGGRLAVNEGEEDLRPMDNRCYPSFSERDGRLFSIWWPAPNAVRPVD